MRGFHGLGRCCFSGFGALLGLGGKLLLLPGFGDVILDGLMSGICPARVAGLWTDCVEFCYYVEVVQGLVCSILCLSR